MYGIKTSRVGRQVVYVPDCANGNTNHPDCRRGFILSALELNGKVFCYFWDKASRSRELVPLRFLAFFNTVDQSNVEKAMKQD